MSPIATRLCGELLSRTGPFFLIGFGYGRRIWWPALLGLSFFLTDIYRGWALGRRENEDHK